MFLGEDDYDDGGEDLGRGMRIYRPRRGTVRHSRRVAARRVAQALKQPLPGVSRVAPRKFGMGLGTVQFVNGGATTLTLSADPQKPFKAQRLMLDVARTGATATGLVTITRFQIGVNSQRINTKAWPVAAFAGDSVDTLLALDPVEPGVNVELDITVSAAPGVGETIDVGGMLIGLTLS